MRLSVVLGFLGFIAFLGFFLISKDKYIEKGAKKAPKREYT